MTERKHVWVILQDDEPLAAYEDEDAAWAHMYHLRGKGDLLKVPVYSSFAEYIREKMEVGK